MLIIPKFISRLDFSSEFQTCVSNCLLHVTSWKTHRCPDLNISPATPNHLLQTCCTFTFSHFDGDISSRLIIQAPNLGVTCDFSLSNMLRNPIGSVFKINPESDYFSPSPLPLPLSEPPWSHVDYHNILLIGLHDSTLVFLQLIFHTAAGMILLKSKSYHVTPLLKTLKWLSDSTWFCHVLLLWLSFLLFFLVMSLCFPTGLQGAQAFPCFLGLCSPASAAWNTLALGPCLANFLTSVSEGA